MVRVLLYTDEPVLSTGFANILAQESFEITSICEHFRDVLVEVKSKRPDVVLLDLTAELSLRGLAEVHQAAPESKLLLWARSISVEMAHHLIELGVRGILRKDLSADLMSVCLRKVAEGELWFERTLTDSLLRAKTVALSPRERQLLKMISCGLSNKQIASELFLSEGTVKVYLSKLFRKTGVKDRFELAIYGLKHLSLSSADEAGLGGAEDKRWPRSIVVQNPPAKTF